MTALIIVSFKSEGWLDRCLSSLLFSNFRGKVFLLDNDLLPAERVQSWTKAFSDLVYKSMGGNTGFAHANNAGIQLAMAEGADLIGFVNPDVWFEKNWFTPLVKLLDLPGGPAMVSPLQLNYDTNELSTWAQKTLGISDLEDPKLEQPFIEAAWLEASCLVTRRDVLERIGPFDELFDLYFEDNDLCRRARLAGYKLGVVPSSRYHHFGGASVGGILSRSRQLKADLGQALFCLTTPGIPSIARWAHLGRWLLRKSRLWMVGENPVFPQLLKSLPEQLWRKRNAIAAKVRCERQLVLNRIFSSSV